MSIIRRKILLSLLSLSMVLLIGCGNTNEKGNIEKTESSEKVEIDVTTEVTENVSENDVSEQISENNTLEKSDDVDVSEWTAAYIQYVEERRTQDEESRYSLLYIDDDNIPELLICYQTNAGGKRIATYYDGKVQDEQLAFGGFYYQKNAGLFMVETGCQGQYPTQIYRMENGKFSQIAEGVAYENVADFYDENYEYDSFYYEWENQPVSEEEFNSNINNIFDKESATEIHDLTDDCTDDIITVLQNFQYFNISIFR